MAYVWIVVQTKDIADKINEALPVADGSTRVEAIFYGQLICGAHYYGQRPNIIIEKYTDVGGGTWTNEILRAGAARDAVFI